MSRMYYQGKFKALFDYSSVAADGWRFIRAGGKSEQWHLDAEEVMYAGLSKKESVTLFLNNIDSLPKCPSCHSAVSFNKCTGRLNKTCSRNCGGVLTQRTRHSDEVKLNTFRQNCSQSAKTAWEQMEASKKEDVFKRIAETRKINDSKLSAEERKARYTHNWAGHYESLRKFYTETDSKVLETFFEKRGIANRRHHSRSMIKEYYRNVWSETEKTYRRWSNVLNPNRVKRGKKYHLDHICSIIDCFAEGVDPKIVGSLSNLRIISAKENMAKSSKSSFTPQELVDGVQILPRKVQTPESVEIQG